MALFDNIRSAMRAYDEEYIENEGPAYDGQLQADEAETDELEYSDPKPRAGFFARREPKQSPVFDAQQPAGKEKLLLVKPREFAEAKEVADNLRFRTVVVNLEATDRETARRLLDFLSGVVYALDGKITRIATSTYLLTPANTTLVGDELAELENAGYSF